jgi:hypothetical protein
MEHGADAVAPACVLGGGQARVYLLRLPIAEQGSNISPSALELALQRLHANAV